jgi:uncharacterized protein YjeT (DUF2065 family)
MHAIQWLVTAIFTANGLMMLVVPELWYHTIPGVIDTGPFNAHFVRDIGIAYLVCGAAFGWLLRDFARAWPAALGAAVFQLLHGGLHIVEVLLGTQSVEHLLVDALAVLVLPTLALRSISTH